MYTILDIRNACREFFTHHTEYITTLEQEQWWQAKDINGYVVWLVLHQDCDPSDCQETVAGFCMIRIIPDSGRYYGTLALYPQFRGQGFGTAIYEFMADQVDELWIDVRNDNAASIKAAENAGFEMHYIGANISEMVCRQ